MTTYTTINFCSYFHLYLFFVQNALKITNISSLPKTIPTISMKRHIVEVSEFVTPIESPTVPRDDANSNAPWIKVHPAKKVKSTVPNI